MPEYKDITAYYFKCNACAHLFVSHEEDTLCPVCGKRNTWKPPGKDKGFSNRIYTTRRIEK